MTEALGLEDTGWQLTAVGRHVVPDDVAPPATFAAGGVTGTGGCNRFTGAYRVDRAALTVGPIASTRMACPGEVGAVEGAFFTALDRVAAHAIAGRSLVLLDALGAGLKSFVLSPDQS